MRRTPEDRDQEATLTRWADDVAASLDDRGLPEVALLFRALARRDGKTVDEALGLYGAPTLEGLVETLLDEIDERREAAEDRFAEILEEVVERALDALESAPLEEPDWDWEDDDLPLS